MTSNSSNLQLHQQHWLFGKRDLTLRSNNTLTVREKSWFRQEETTLPLELLQPNPTHASTFAMKWLLNSLFIGSISLLFGYLGIRFNAVVLYALCAIFTVFTLVLLYRFFVYTTNLVIYRHVQTNENFLYLWKDKPNREEFWEFTHELTRRISLNKRT